MLPIDEVKREPKPLTENELWGNPASQQPAPIREALEGLLKQLPVISCEHWHHGKNDRHDGFTPCPVQARWDAAVEKAFTALGTPGREKP